LWQVLLSPKLQNTLSARKRLKTFFINVRMQSKRSSERRRPQKLRDLNWVLRWTDQIISGLLPTEFYMPISAAHHLLDPTGRGLRIFVQPDLRFEHD